MKGFGSRPVSHRGLRWALASALAFFTALALDYALEGGTGLAFSNSVASLLAAAACFVLYDRFLVLDRRGMFWPTWLPALMMAAFFTVGARTEADRTVEWLSPKLYGAVLMLSAAFKAGLALLYSTLKSRGERQCLWTGEQNGLGGWFAGTRAWWCVSMGALLLCWLPAWLAMWPGAFLYDTYGQWIQVSTGQYSQANPMLHTLLLGGLLELGNNLFGGYNAGGAVYTAIQLLLLSGCLTISLGVWRRLRLPGAGQLLFLAYFMLSPVVHMFAVTSVKDVLFSGFALAAGLLLMELTLRGKAMGKPRLALLTALIFLAGAFRRGALAFIALLLILVWMIQKENRKTVVGVSIAALALSAGWSLVCAYGLSAPKGSKKELLSVPVAQLTWAYANRSGEMPMQQQEEIFDCFIISEDFVREMYKPECVDYPKYCLKEEKIGDFLRTWAKTAIEYPGEYLDAFCVLSRKAWYPTSIIDGYCTGSGSFATQTCYFQLNDVNRPVEPQSKFPALYRLYYKLGTELSFQKVPVLSMLMAPGFMLWLMLGALFYLIWQRRWRALTPIVLPLLVHCIYAFGPVILVRYFLLSFFTAPVCVLLVLYTARFSLKQKDAAAESQALLP